MPSLARMRCAPAREQPSNQVSKDRHWQRWTPANIDGRCFPWSDMPQSWQPTSVVGFGTKKPCRSGRCPPVRLSVCPLHCRIKPYWIKAAPAAPLARRQRRAQPLGGPPVARRATHAGHADQSDSHNTQAGGRAAVLSAPDCPARGHRDRVGGGVGPPPPTPPDMRARIRRFVKPSD
jgi:hypothetical protein